MSARAAILLLLVLGCAPTGDTHSPRAGITSAVGEPVASGSTAPVGQTFDPGPAAPDSGILWARFMVPRTDNRGTCEAPQPDSAYDSDALWARVYRERRVYDGTTVYDESRADSFPVRRGETVTWWKRVPCDTFDLNVRLYKGVVPGCRKYLLGQIVTPSTPPTPVILP